jgi:hypothetical protein
VASWTETSIPRSSSSVCDMDASTSGSSSSSHWWYHNSCWQADLKVFKLR